MDFIDNSNIDGSCLNRDKLTLNRKRTAAVITGREGAFVRDEVNSLDNHSGISEMKTLRLRNPKI